MRGEADQRDTDVCSKRSPRVECKMFAFVDIDRFRESTFQGYAHSLAYFPRTCLCSAVVAKLKLNALETFPSLLRNKLY